MVLLLTIILLFTALGPKKWVNGSEKLCGNNLGRICGIDYSIEGSFAKISSVERSIRTNLVVASTQVDNPNLVNEAEAEIAFAQTDIPAYSTEGKLRVESDNAEDVKTKVAIGSEPLQVVTSKDAGEKSVAKHKSKKDLNEKNKYNEKNCFFNCKKTMISRK